MPTLAEIDPELHRSLEEKGENAVRADYESGQVYGSSNRPRVLMWLIEKEAERDAQIDEREERMVAAAQKSADATHLAMRAAIVSATIAGIALVVSIIALMRDG